MSITKLKVPFVEKEHAKSLGARWNPIEKIWFVPSGVDTKPFSKWIDEDLSGSDESTESQLSLSQYLYIISGAIAKVASNAVWVRAEISYMSGPKKGHYYLDLVEQNEDGFVVAKAQAAIWQQYSETIFDKFYRATNANIEANIKVLLFVTTDFHPLYGLKLKIEDIDPTYTLGDMAAKLADIRKQLIHKKIYKNNKSLHLPNNYFRVAVISPDQAAGLGDFKKEAEILSQFNLCEFKYYHAQFQGMQAPQEIIKAIKMVLMDHEVGPFDALVIIRGGGAVTDLAWLNDYELAETICLLPIPLFSGIGHQKDNTIIDEIANTRFDTPSKVSHYIFTVICNTSKLIENAYIEIYEIASYSIDKYETEIAYFKSNIPGYCVEKCEQANINIYHQAEIIKQSARYLLKNKTDYMRHIYREIFSNSHNIVDTAIDEIKQYLGYRIFREFDLITTNALMMIEQYYKEAVGANPAMVLEKGFALAMSKDGSVISSVEKAIKIRDFLIKFKDGTLEVKANKKIKG